MDQQQAVDFTQKALARGATPEQVAYVLAERLNAPVEALLPFVQKVAAEAAVPENAPPPPAQTMEEEPITLVQGFSVVRPPLDEPGPVTEVYEEPEFLVPEMPVPQPVETEPAVVVAPAAPPPPTSGLREPRPRGRMAALYQNPEISQMVTQELNRHRKPSDIALKLSQKYGVQFADAERYVAQVSAKLPNQPRRKTNFVMLGFSSISLLAGLALLVIGVLSLLEGFFGQPSDRLSQVLGTLIGGGLLTLGGVIGLYITLRPTSR